MNKINNAVFPALQGGPHEHQIAGVATQLLEAMTPEFKEYIIQVQIQHARCTVDSRPFAAVYSSVDLLRRARGGGLVQWVAIPQLLDKVVWYTSPAG